MTPDTLRAQGYTVKFYHLRRWVAKKPVVFATIGEVVNGLVDDPEIHDRALSPNGGQTLCVISKDGTRLASGTSIVSLADTYDKRTGRIKSFGRAWGDFQKKLPDEAVH